MHSDYQLSPRNRLRSLFEESNLSLSTRDVERVGRRLANVIGRGKPFSRRYLISILNGTLVASKSLDNAIDALLAETDGANPYLVTSATSSVYHDKNRDLEGAYVMSDAKVCENCIMVFVPNVPHRKFCPVCSPPRRK